MTDEIVYPIREKTSTMKVHGMNQGKEVTLELSMREIAESGIDPWRLDLMDPCPVVVNIRGREIAFSRLSDVVFAYSVGGTMYVCAHDGKKGVCFYGDSQDSTENQVHLRDFKVSTRPFIEHFAEYLALAPPESLCDLSAMVVTGAPGSGKSAFASTLAAAMKRGKTELVNLKPRARPTYVPRPYSDLRLKGDRLHYSALSALRPRIFRGAMFESRAFHGVVLPDQINWVHTTFGAWRPVVQGTCLARALLGVNCQRFDFSVASAHLDAVKAFVGSSLNGAEIPDNQLIVLNLFGRSSGTGVQASFLFRYEGRDYMVWTDDRFAKNQQFTIDGLASDGTNQVRGTRIAFHDLGQRLMRRIEFGSMAKLLDQGQPEDSVLKRVEPEHLPDGDATTSN